MCTQGAYTRNEADKIPETWAALLDLFAKKQIRGVVYDKVYEYVVSFFVRASRAVSL